MTFRVPEPPPPDDEPQGRYRSDSQPRQYLDPRYVEPGPKSSQPTSPLKALLGPLIFLGFLLLKFGKVAFIAVKGLKFLSTSLSMLVSIGAYTLLWGWKFAVGFVLLMFVHEMGHVWQARREGLDVSAPFFVPFLGAAIMMRQQPQSAMVEARIAMAGPVVGSIGALAVYWLALDTGSDFLQALAFTGFFLNLFNLVPLSPLDGGRIVAALSPTLWAVGVVVMVGLVIVAPNPVLILIVILGLVETWKRWKGRKEESHYYDAVTPRQRSVIGASYLGLVLLLALLMQASFIPREL